MKLEPRILITRKEVAQVFGVTVDQIRKNEERLGLLPARVDLNGRCVRYIERIVQQAAKSFFS